MKVYMGNSILVALKPHSRGSSTVFSSTYPSALSYLGIPALTQRRNCSGSSPYILVLPPLLHRPQELGLPRMHTSFLRERMDANPRQSLSLQMTEEQRHIIHSTGGKEVCP